MDTPGERFPLLVQVVLDTTDARGWPSSTGGSWATGTGRATSHRPPGPDPRGRDWLVLRDAAGADKLAFQQVKELPEPTWPEGPRPQMLHLLYRPVPDLLRASRPSNRR